MDLFKSMFLCFLIVLYQNLDAYGKPISSKCKSVDEDKLGNLSAFFSSLWSQAKTTYNQTVHIRSHIKMNPKHGTMCRLPTEFVYPHSLYRVNKKQMKIDEHLTRMESMLRPFYDALPLNFLTFGKELRTHNSLRSAFRNVAVEILQWVIAMNSLDCSPSYRFTYNSSKFATEVKKYMSCKGIDDKHFDFFWYATFSEALNYAMNDMLTDYNFIENTENIEEDACLIIVN